MKILLAGSISYNVMKFRAEVSPSCMNLASLIICNPDPKREWARMRSAAMLIAEEFEEAHPDLSNYRDVAWRLPFGRIGNAIDQLSERADRLFGLDGGIASQSALLRELLLEGSILEEEELQLAMDFIRDNDPLSRATIRPGIVFSQDPFVTASFLAQQKGLTADNLLAILAISGIKVSLPNFGVASDAAIAEIREKLAEERAAYIGTLRTMVKECFEGVSSGQYADAYQFADMVTNQRLLADVTRLETAASKLDKKLVRRITDSVVRDLPSLVPTILTPQLLGAQLLKILCEVFSGRETIDDLKAQFPGANYVYSLKNFKVA